MTAIFAAANMVASLVFLVLVGCHGSSSSRAPAEAGPCGKAEACPQLAAKSEREVEQEEAEGVGAMEVRLIQSRLQRLPLARTGSGTKAASEIIAASSSSTHTFDNNGNLCLLCSKPKADRVGGKVYKEFRSDCGSKSGPEGPSKESLLMPAASLMERSGDGKRSTNAFCELNYAKSCADAVANWDYLYWAKSLDFTAPEMHGGAVFDARYCHANGFLEEDVVALQHNFTALRDRARGLCETKYAKRGIERLSFVDGMRQARYGDPTAPSLDEAEALAAWNCAMGDLGCDMAGCAYSFCSKGENSYGIYDECQGWDPVRGMRPESGQVK